MPLVTVVASQLLVLLLDTSTPSQVQYHLHSTLKNTAFIFCCCLFFLSLYRVLFRDYPKHPYSFLTASFSFSGLTLGKHVQTLLCHGEQPQFCWCAQSISEQFLTGSKSRKVRPTWVSEGRKGEAFLACSWLLAQAGARRNVLSRILQRWEITLSLDLLGLFQSMCLHVLQPGFCLNCRNKQ